MAAEKDPDRHGILVRLHLNDWKMLKKLFIDEGMNFQAFVESCVMAYLHGNKEIMKVVKAYKEFKEVPMALRESKTLSQRERDALLREIEAEEKASAESDTSK